MHARNEAERILTLVIDSFGTRQYFSADAEAATREAVAEAMVQRGILRVSRGRTEEGTADLRLATTAFGSEPAVIQALVALAELSWAADPSAACDYFLAAARTDAGVSALDLTYAQWRSAQCQTMAFRQTTYNDNTNIVEAEVFLHARWATGNAAIAETFVVQFWPALIPMLPDYEPIAFQ